MSASRTTQGHSRGRPYYTQREIERLCSAELLGQGLMPDRPSPIRIERFVEKRFGVAVQYEDLPDGVLGFTLFEGGSVSRIYVAKALAEDESRVAERRVSTTLAHESGHGLLHAHLFADRVSTRALFENCDDVVDSKILCRETTVEPRPTTYDGRWWELQANMAIGPLLLPANLVRQCLEPLFEPTGNLGLPHLRSERRTEAIELLTATFDVNPVVARIRLDRLLPGDDRQLTL